MLAQSGKGSNRLHPFKQVYSVDDESLPAEDQEWENKVNKTPLSKVSKVVFWKIHRFRS